MVYLKTVRLILCCHNNFHVVYLFLVLVGYPQPCFNCSVYKKKSSQNTESLLYCHYFPCLQLLFTSTILLLIYYLPLILTISLSDYTTIYSIFPNTILSKGYISNYIIIINNTCHVVGITCCSPVLGKSYLLLVWRREKYVHFFLIFLFFSLLTFSKRTLGSLKAISSRS